MNGSKDVNETYGRFSDFFAISGVNNGADEGFDAADLTNDRLVPLIVARQVGQNASGASNHIHVAGAQQLH